MTDHAPLTTHRSVTDLAPPMPFASRLPTVFGIGAAGPAAAGSRPHRRPPRGPAAT